MPGLQGDGVAAALASPVKRSKLSLKFFQRKETKRALDFSEPQVEEAKEAEELEASGCDQVVPGPSPRPASPGLLLSGEKRESLVPFVGLNNLGNTCYLNSILQVLYYCPGLREGIKRLHTLTKKTEKPSEESEKTEEPEGGGAESLPAHLELLGSFNSLITSVEQLQSRFLLDPDSFGEGELATPPRKILHTLRQLNPMYEGFLQHDAQEVLQCILGYIQEACDTIRKEREQEEPKAEGDDSKTSPPPLKEEDEEEEEDGQVSGKRKSDTEVGNAKKKPKSAKSKKAEAEKGEEEGAGSTTRSKTLTRSKRKSSSSSEVAASAAKGDEDEEEKKLSEAAAGEAEKTPKEAEGKRKRRGRLGWPKASGKQPSIFSKFLSVGKLTTSKSQSKAEENREAEPEKKVSEAPTASPSEEEEKPVKQQEGLDLMERMFQGQLVLRTRCLECECFTERREDFQDISVPVLDEQPSSPDDLSEVSPDPKPELKTLKWAIGQFASVERIVGEDKYFCETCHHYTEAERSLLFDKTPEVVTIHLKRFSANGLELDPYAGLSKVNTPLQTPLSLSLEEWCTPPSSSRGQHYQLFGVVMHSGVTISSGHYTAYVRMSGLKDAKLWPRQGEDEEEEPAEEAAAADYDDGEVSFRLSRQRGGGLASGKMAAKKPEGGVGLLGGQRSFSGCELAASKAADGPKRRKTVNAEAKKEDGVEAAAASGGKMAATEQQALGNLLEYEGRWLLFDDSEVRLFEEDEFLQACSPDTCSASTPYLLFYRRVPKH